MKKHIKLIMSLAFLLSFSTLTSCNQSKKGQANVSQVSNLYIYIDSYPVQGVEGIQQLGEPISLSIASDVGEKKLKDIIQDAVDNINIQDRIDRAIALVRQNQSYQGAEGLIFDNTLNTVTVFKFK